MMQDALTHIIAVICLRSLCNSSIIPTVFELLKLEIISSGGG